MRFKLAVSDPQQVLGELDDVQLQNIVWIRLAPIKDKVQSVQVRVARLSHPKGGHEHFVKVSTELVSGSFVRVISTERSLDRAIVTAADLMHVSVIHQLRLDEGWFSRAFRFLRERVRPNGSTVRMLAQPHVP